MSYFFEIFKALDICFKHFLSGTRTGSGQGICRLDENVQDTFRSNILMVSGNGMNHFSVFSILFGQISANTGVGAFDLMINSLANVMEKPGPLCLLYIDSELRGHYSTEKSNLKGMLEHILTKTCPVFQPANKLNNFRVHAMGSNIKCCLLASLPHGNIKFFCYFFDNFFNTGRMNPAISNKLFQGLPGNLATNGIES